MPRDSVCYLWNHCSAYLDSYSVGEQVFGVPDSLCLCVSGFMEGQTELVRLCNCACLGVFINACVSMNAVYQSPVCTYSLVHHNLTHLLTHSNHMQANSGQEVEFSIPFLFYPFFVVYHQSSYCTSCLLYNSFSMILLRAMERLCNKVCLGCYCKHWISIQYISVFKFEGG